MKKKKIYKLKARISVNPALTEKIGDFMSGLDLGIVGVETPITEILSWTTITKPTPGYKMGIEKAVKDGFKKDGARVIEFEWL